MEVNSNTVRASAIDAGRYRADSTPAAHDDLVLDSVLAVVRAWRWIAAAAVLGALAAAGYRALLPPVYEASTTLGVVQPSAAASPANVTTSRVLIQNQGLATEIVREFNLQAAPHNMNAVAFLDRAMRVEDIRGTTLLRVLIRLSAPDLSVKVANAVGARAVALAVAVTQQESITARDQLNTQREAAAARLTQTESALLEYRRRARVELLKRDIESRLAQRDRLRRLTIELAAETAKLQKTEAELRARQPVLSLNRRMAEESPVMTEAARAAGVSGSALLGLEMKSESPNPVFTQLDTNVATARVVVAGLEREQNQLLAQGGLQAADGVLSELYAGELELSRRDNDYRLALKVFDDVSLRFEQARAQIASRSPLLQIIDPAVSARQAPRRLLLFALLGAIGAVFLATMAPIVLLLGRRAQAHGHAG